MVEEILTVLAKSSPLVGVLVSWLWYSITQSNKIIDKREAEITALHAQIRANEKENLEIFLKVNQTLNEIANDNDNLNKDIIKEIQNLKEFINLKLRKE